MHTVRQALLELINMQKERISRLEVEKRHLATELSKWSDTTGYHSMLQAEVGEELLVYGESWVLLNRDRAAESITLKRRWK